MGELEDGHERARKKLGQLHKFDRVLQREEWIKHGGIERCDIGGISICLYWEVWRSDAEIRDDNPLRPRFIVERGTLSGRVTSKAAFDHFEDAANQFRRIEREHAIAEAMRALGLIGKQP